MANEAGSTEIEFEELAGGEFAQDAAKEVIEAKQAGKSHKKEAHISKVNFSCYLSLRLTCSLKEDQG